MSIHREREFQNWGTTTEMVLPAVASHLTPKGVQKRVSEQFAEHRQFDIGACDLSDFNKFIKTIGFSSQVILLESVESKYSGT